MAKKKVWNCHAGQFHEIGCPHRKWPKKIEKIDFESIYKAIDNWSGGQEMFLIQKIGDKINEIIDVLNEENKHE